MWIWIERLEGLVFFLVALYAYYLIGASWVLFAMLILLPDIAMIGYLKDAVWGARIYNLGHFYTMPIALYGIAVYFNFESWILVAIVWFAHIAADRALGYGLKLPTGFRDTHLGRIGK